MTVSKMQGFEVPEAGAHLASQSLIRNLVVAWQSTSVYFGLQK